MNTTFTHCGSLFAVPARPECRAVVVIPARNEEAALPAALDALRLQRKIDDTALPYDTYEVLVLLNNCTDTSLAVALEYAFLHPELRLHIAERTLPTANAHVGTARHMLMEVACERLEVLDETEAGPRAILSTDADTEVAPDWIARNLAALEAGADAVGGVIHLRAAELTSLDSRVRACYEQDRRLQALVAHVESLYDPDPADPWPRHLQHFGASLACTCAIYRRSGGLPAVQPLEDVAFVDALRRVGARVRHAPEVHIHTSARLDGRAEVGLSGQLRYWRRECDEGVPHLVDSAEWMVHRFRWMGALRRAHEGMGLALASVCSTGWQIRITEHLAEQTSFPQFLERLDYNLLIEESFHGARRAAISEVIDKLELELESLQAASATAVSLRE
jgi:GT2 family glycosyltransferase